MNSGLNTWFMNQKYDYPNRQAKRAQKQPSQNVSFSESITPARGERMIELDDYRVEENSFELAKRLNKPFLVSQMLPAYTKDTNCSQKLLNLFKGGRDDPLLTPVRPMSVVKTRTFNKQTQRKNMHGPKES